MKPKTLVTAAIVVAFAVSTLFVARSCRIGGKYAAMKQQYAGYRLIAEADHAMSLSRVAELNKSIGQMDESIVKLKTEVSSKTRQLAVVSTRLDELQRAEPIQPELEKEPLVVNLRGQVKTLTEMYSLSQQTITLQTREIDAWWGKYRAQESISKEWEANYNREHALRLSCKSMNKQLEKQYRVARLKGRVATVACAAALGVVGYQLLKN